MDENKKGFVNVSQASRITGLSLQTIRSYCDQEKIKCFKTPDGGHRRIDRHYLEEFVSKDFCIKNTKKKNPKYEETTKNNYIYARVSSRKQMDDLSRQVEYIQGRRQEYSSYITITDIASGINFKRKGLETILDSCLQGNVGEIVIAHKDRLSRFGFELIKLIVEKTGGKITILDDEKNKSTEQELAEDLLSIVHIYSCKQMGKRSYKSRQAKSEDFENKIETNSPSEEDN